MKVRCDHCFGEYEKELGMCPFCGHAEGDPAAEAFCLAPGSVISDRYIIGEMLGLGGFGITYKAWDTKLSIMLAIKEYYPSGLVNRLPGDTEVFLVATKREREFAYGKTRFLEEARNMAKFSTHKNIVNVYDFFEANNTAYIVMEFLEGQTLSQMLHRQNAPLPYDRCASVAVDVCKALKAIHKENILHRDVSPDNIMICTDGTVKLFDFGAARFSAGVENRVTVVVKPGFAPPEQYDKVNRQDPRTDIYALGATLYYAMTGVKPEESTNRKIEDTVVEPSAIDPSIPANISTAVMRAMAVEQQYRFPTVDALEKALTSEKKVVSVKKERARRRRRRALGVLLSLLVILGAAGVFYFVWDSKRGESVLPDSHLTVWYVAAGDEELDEHKAKALADVVDVFCTEYSNVTVELVPVPEKDYGKRLNDAIRNGNGPAVFESTTVSKKTLSGALPLTDSRAKVSETVYGEMELDSEARFPTGIIVPIIYVRTSTPAKEIVLFRDLDQVEAACSEMGTTVSVKADDEGMYRALYGDGVRDHVTGNGAAAFIAGQSWVYFGDSADYKTIRDGVPGEYAVFMPETGNGTYRWGETWSVTDTDRKTNKSAVRFVEYLCSDLAQDHLYIQTQSGSLPILKSKHAVFYQVYDELSGIGGFLSLPYVAPK